MQDTRVSVLLLDVQGEAPRDTAKAKATHNKPTTTRRAHCSAAALHRADPTVKRRAHKWERSPRRTRGPSIKMKEKARDGRKKGEAMRGDRAQRQR